ncbi:MAG: type II toxin-antitoxin system HipA family toxin [Bacteroidota bacterium]|uniref:type II toxin-antitoxin system HipA family toxin n=1 Tax=Longimonas sp. TaxID=2039626 RepID=UPI0039751F1A
MHDVQAGVLTATDEGYSKVDFISSYIEYPNRPVLGQNFEDDLRKTYRGKGKRLPPFFANLVPEGALRTLMEDTLHLPSGDDLALLDAVQHDLPGAVRIEREADPQTSIEEKQAELKRVAKETNDAEHEGLRFSLAGVQMKFSVLQKDKRITVPGSSEYGAWLVKLDAPTFPKLVENEFSMLQWAHEAGFDVPKIRLLRASDLPASIRRHAPEGSRALQIKRYDRVEGERVHQEDFNQVVGQDPRHKYDHIRYEDLAVLARAIVGESAYDEVVRRLVFMIATGNADAHLKNWSLIYPDRINAALSPLYDQVATVAWHDKNLNQNWALKFAGSKDPFQTNQATFERFAEKTTTSPQHVQTLVEETLEQIAKTWSDIPARDLMLPHHITALQTYWKRVPLLKPYASALEVP